MVLYVSGSDTVPVGPTRDGRIDPLLASGKWASEYISYSFPNSEVDFPLNPFDGGSKWDNIEYPYFVSEPYDKKYRSLDDNEQHDFKQALQTWSEVANVEFNFIDEGVDPTEVGDIRVAFTGDMRNKKDDATTVSPEEGTSSRVGDIWINTKTNFKGNYFEHALVHEIGHALGLKHSFEEPHTLGDKNTYQYTVMSYRNLSDSYWNGVGKDVYPQSPMLYDILAIQSLYGSNLGTRNGPDVYTFAARPAEVKTIWDGGGEDEFNLENQVKGTKVDLRVQDTDPNALGGEYFSSIGVTSNGKPAENNIAIAFGVTIENVSGSNFDDEIIANEVNNEITGNLGNDKIVLFPISGNDADTLRYTSALEGVDEVENFTVMEDKFDFSDFLIPEAGKNWIDYVKLTAENGGTLVSVDPTGSGGTLYDMAFLQGVNPDTLTADNFGLPDAPPPALPVLSIAMDVGDQAEGTGGTTDFTFKLTRSILAPCSVTYTVAGSGEHPADNADFVAEDLVGTVTFAAGDASLTKMITVRVNGDTEPEPDETFTVTLNNPSGATIHLVEGSAEGIIYNDDIASPPPVTFSIEPATQTIGEGDGTASFTISRSDFTAAQTVYVSTVQDQGFQNNADYAGIVDLAIPFAAGDDQPQTVAVTILDDVANPEVEPDETFSLLVENTPGGTSLASATFTIADNDTPAPSTIVLDQMNDQLSPALQFNGGTSTLQWQQGVTAGLTGRLAQIDLYFWQGGNVELSLNDGAPWQYDASDFKEIISILPGWNSIDVTSAILNVDQGGSFTIGIRGLGDTGEPWFGGTEVFNQDGYIGGDIYLNEELFNFSEPRLFVDMGFRTYVDIEAGANLLSDDADALLV